MPDPCPHCAMTRKDCTAKQRRAVDRRRVNLNRTNMSQELIENTLITYGWQNRCCPHCRHY